MNSAALIMMVTTMAVVTLVTIALFVKVFRTPTKPDEGDEPDGDGG
jgi:hypothetical protein